MYQQGEKDKMAKKKKMIVDIDIWNCRILAAKPADQTLVVPNDVAAY